MVSNHAQNQLQASRVLSPSEACRIYQAIESVMFEPDPGLPTLPGYLVFEQMSHGGGAVYRALQERTEREVVIKFGDRPSAQQRRTGSRLMLEFEALKLLPAMPGVPRVVDHGIHEGRPFIVTDFIEGSHIDRWCVEQDLDQRQRVRLMVSLAHTTQRIHEKQIIHRDIKPSNVIVSTDGTPHLIDLGVAILNQQNNAASETQHGLVIGTPLFMSPEQARGNQTAVSTRSDVYGLGALALFLLTSRALHDADIPIRELVLQIGSQRVAALPEARDGRPLPAALQAVLSKATAFDPQDRYASAEEFADDLERWLSNEPVTARRFHALERASLFARRRPGTFATAAAAVLLSMCLFVLAGWGLSQKSLADEQAELRRQEEILSAEYRDKAQRLRERIIWGMMQLAATARTKYSDGDIIRAMATVRAMDDLRKANTIDDEEALNLISSYLDSLGELPDHQEELDNG